MASMLTEIPPTFRLLDPGAGIGALTAAVCERISLLESPRNVHVTAFENDDAVVPLLKETLGHCERLLRSRGHVFTYEIVVDDFLVCASQQAAPKSLFGDSLT